MSRVFLRRLATVLGLATATLVLPNAALADDPPLWAWRQHDLRQIGLSLQYEQKTPLPDYCRGEIAIRRNLRSSYQYEIFFPVPEGVPRIPLPYTKVHVVVERLRGKLVATVRYLDDAEKEVHPKNVLKDKTTNCPDLMEQVAIAIQIANLQHTPDLPKVTPPPNVPEPPPPPPPPCLPAKEAPRPKPPPPPPKPRKATRTRSIELGASGALAWDPRAGFGAMGGLFLRRKWLGLEARFHQIAAPEVLSLMGCMPLGARKTFESCGLLLLDVDNDAALLRGGLRFGARFPLERVGFPLLFRVYAEMDADPEKTVSGLLGVAASSHF